MSHFPFLERKKSATGFALFFCHPTNTRHGDRGEAPLCVADAEVLDDEVLRLKVVLYHEKMWNGRYRPPPLLLKPEGKGGITTTAPWGSGLGAEDGRGLPAG